MPDMDRSLSQQFRKEADDLLFSNIKLNDRMKQNIRQQAASEKTGRRMLFPKSWMMGMSAVAAAAIIIAGYPMLQQPAAPAPIEDPAGSLPPSNGGASGSHLSQLVTTTLGSVEEAKAAFGAGLLVPSAAPDGYSLSEIQAVSEGDVVRDVVITYVSGDKAVTVTASRNPAIIPVDMFTQTTVNGVEGLVYEQPAFTELYWVEGGIQYSVMGPITGNEAMETAESVQP